jgi:two-component system, cell cycle sensor histidine kinase and response regulator CckA
VREVARRSRPGAMVYFATIASLPLASPCLTDHPSLTIAALACTFVAGVTRIVAATQLLRRPVPHLWWARTLEASTLLTAGPWGLFCAAILYFYMGSWPSTYLLIAGAALAGGVVTSLAPHVRLSFSALLLIVLPTGACALWIGTTQSEILGISAFGYLAFLMVQLQQTWQAYWKAATAPALDAMLSRRAATQSEGRFETLFADAPSGIYLAFLDGRVEICNRALAQLLGYSAPEEIAGLNLKNFSPDSDFAGVRRRIEESGYLAGWESDWRRQDGVQIRVRESVRAVQAGSDAQGRLLGIVEDVTVRFVAEQARRQLIEILEGTSDFVESVAATGETLYMNRASRGLLSGGSAESTESVWNRSGDVELRKNRLRFASDEGIWQGESWLLASDGRPVPVSQVIISHRRSDGSTHSYSIISRDISAMRAAQKALRETQEQLFQAQRLESLGRLAGGVAHDFNNLLTIIMGNASFLAEEATDTDTLDGLLEIGKAAERAADLTRQLLAFGRKQALTKGVIDVKEVVKGAERMLRRLIGERVELVTRVSAEPQTVMTDAGQLEQVLINLILNGRDAMPHGGVATIETSTVRGASNAAQGGPPRDYIRIAVSDTGIGMDEETMARVFEPFFTTKAQGRGTGLGLATAYGFIQQSEGTISVSSQPGKGTVFSILLPACTAVVGVAQQPAIGSTMSGSEHILVVDDEPALRGLLRQTLAGHGYRVEEARDGEEALAVARRSPVPFDLLVTDVIMPGMTGPQLARSMQSIFPAIAVLFVSGYPGETEADRAAFGPDSAWLAKPFTADVLLRSVRYQIERGRAVAAEAG